MLALSVQCFHQELGRAERNRVMEETMVRNCVDQTVSGHWDGEVLRSQLLNQFILASSGMEIGIYSEDHRTRSGRLQDGRLPMLRDWLLDPLKRPEIADDRLMRS